MPTSALRARRTRAPLHQVEDVAALAGIPLKTLDRLIALGIVWLARRRGRDRLISESEVARLLDRLRRPRAVPRKRGRAR